MTTHDTSALFRTGSNIEAQVRSQYPSPKPTGQSYLTPLGETIRVVTAPVVTFGGVVLPASDNGSGVALLEFAVIGLDVDHALRRVAEQVLGSVEHMYSFVGILRAVQNNERWLAVRPSV